MLDEQILQVIYTELSVAINKMAVEYQGSSLTDIYLVLDEDSGELSVYDDEQNLFHQLVIPQWSGDTDVEEILRYLRKVVEDLDLANIFDKLDIYKPFSVNFSDDNFIVIEELLTIEDDSIIRVDNEFLKKIDSEFDDFLDNLMKE